MSVSSSAERAKPLTGTHILGGVFTGDEVQPTMESLQTRIPKMIVEANLTELGSVFHAFENGGYTAIIALAESHLSVHTWPELGYVTIDVFICNVQRDNAEVCEKLFFDLAALFHPLRVEHTKILR